MCCSDRYFIIKKKIFTASVNLPELRPSCLLAQGYYQGEPETQITKDVSHENTWNIKGGLGFFPFLRDRVREI